MPERVVSVAFYAVIGVLHLLFALALIWRAPRRELNWVLFGLFTFNGAGALAFGVWLSTLAGDRFPRQLFELFEQSTMFLLAYLGLAFPKRPRWARQNWIVPVLVLVPMVSLAVMHLADWDETFLLARSYQTPLNRPRLVFGYLLPASVWTLFVIRWTASWMSDLTRMQRLQMQVLFAAFGMRAANILVASVEVNRPGATAVLVAIAQASNVAPLLVLGACLGVLALAPNRPERTRGQSLFILGFLFGGLLFGSMVVALGYPRSLLHGVYLSLDLYYVRPVMVWLAIAYLGLLGPRWKPNRMGAVFIAILTFATLALALYGGISNLVEQPWALTTTVAASGMLTALLASGTWPVLTGRAPWRLEEQGHREEWLPGDQVLGKYRIESFLGEGTCGATYLAYDQARGHRVVLKRTARIGSVESRTLLHEARSLQNLQHPNLVRLWGTEWHGGEPILVLEHISAGSLQTRLETGKRLTAGKAVSIAGDVLSALEATHRAGILHRDIKPSNILLEADGTAKLADFGIASAQTPGLLLGTEPNAQSPVGSLRYMAPEQLRGLPSGHRADLYAMAVVLHELLAGQHPFSKARTDYEVRRAIAEGKCQRLPTHVPKRLAKVVQRGLQKNPANRFQSASEFLHALDAAYPERKTRLERPTPRRSPEASG